MFSCSDSGRSGLRAGSGEERVLSDHGWCRCALSEPMASRGAFLCSSVHQALLHCLIRCTGGLGPCLPTSSAPSTAYALPMQLYAFAFDALNAFIIVRVRSGPLQPIIWCAHTMTCNYWPSSIALGIARCSVGSERLLSSKVRQLSSVRHENTCC